MENVMVDEVGKFEVGKKYYRPQSDKSRKHLMIMVFMVDKIAGNLVYGTELITGEEIRFNGILDSFSRNFYPINKLLLKPLFEMIFDGTAIFWNPDEDAEWEK